MRKIAISLRSSDAVNYSESRDALAVDWYAYMQRLGWNHNWMLLPNLGNDTAEYAREHNVEGLILTGGDSLGSNQRRDSSEKVLLDFAIQQQLPVLGVCRGLQLIYTQFGGQLINTNNEKHVATRHQINLTSCIPFPYGEGNTLEVNSYHSQLLAPGKTELKIMANDNDGFAEAIINSQLKIAGVMWHPEREPSCSSFDRALFNWLFKD